MTSYVPVQGILKGKSPDRDREIEAFQNMIKGAAAAGIPCVKYLMSILGNVRTGTDPGPGRYVLPLVRPETRQGAKATGWG